MLAVLHAVAALDDMRAVTEAAALPTKALAAD
jgi:hypothetical protein